MKQVAVITTGGTIAMNCGVPSDENFGASGVDFLPFANEPSPYFDSDFAYKLANYINEISFKYSALVVTHGTDTMEESTFYCDLVLDLMIPVVFTGAIHMRNHPAYDGEANLQNAIVAAKSLASGVYIAFDSDILPARFATKTNAISRRAFSAPKCGRVGQVLGSRYINFLDLPKRKTVLKPTPKGSILLMRSHYDISSDLIRSAVQNADGVVLEGFGGGRVPKDLLDLISEFAYKKPLVITGSAIESTTGDEYLYAGGFAWAKEKNIPIIYSQADGKKSAIALNLAMKNGVDLMRYFDEEIC